MYIAICIPTLNRKAKLRRCISAILDSTYTAYSIHAAEDVDRLGIFKCQERLVWANKADAYLMICDDIELKPDCIEKAVRAMQEHYPDTDGLIGLHQNGVSGHPFTQWGQTLIGAKYIERFPNKQFYCPIYTTFYADTEMGLCAQELGKFHFCKEADMTHHHPVWAPEEMDSTHEFGRRPDRGQKDEKTFKARQDAGLLWGRSYDL